MDRVRSYSGFEESCCAYSQCTMHFLLIFCVSGEDFLLLLPLPVCFSFLESLLNSQLLVFFSTVLWKRLSQHILPLSEYTSVCQSGREAWDALEFRKVSVLSLRVQKTTHIS